MTVFLRNILIYIFLIALPTSGCCTKFNWGELAYALNHHPEHFDLKEIIGGTTNKNYHLKIANREFFVRMPLSENGELGASLAMEYQILNKIGYLGVSPRAYFYSEEQKTMFTQYIHHDDQLLNFNDEKDRKKLISLVKSIHESEINVDIYFNPYETINQAIKFINSLGIQLPDYFDTTIPKMLDRIEKSNAFQYSATLCHHDIHPGNILKNGDSYFLVDWEYGAMSDPLYDIASIASIAFWDMPQMLQFLKEYHPHHTEKEWQRMNQLRLLADIRWYLWCEIQNHLHPQDPIYAVWRERYLKNIPRNY